MINTNKNISLRIFIINFIIKCLIEFLFFDFITYLILYNGLKNIELMIINLLISQ